MTLVVPGGPATVPALAIARKALAKWLSIMGDLKPVCEALGIDRDDTERLIGAVAEAAESPDDSTALKLFALYAVDTQLKCSSCGHEWRLNVGKLRTQRSVQVTRACRRCGNYTSIPDEVLKLIGVVA